MKKLFFVVAVVFLCVSCSETTKQTAEKPKYIFLFIGDGMGLAQTQLADAFLRSQGDSLDFMYFPNRAFQTTWSYSSYITCSAASGTAMACGSKTYANYIGVDSAGSPLKSVAYTAKEHGKRVGILTSVPIDHATPAAFYAHSLSRDNAHEIDMQLPLTNFDFFGGGMFVNPISDTSNVFNLLKKNNYMLVTSSDSLKYVPLLNQKVCVLRHKDSRLELEIDRNDDLFSLENLTETAIKTLDNPNGFFMMVEGGMIDWAAHSNDAATVAHEVIGFNNAIKKAVTFYNQHPEQTLIIVTADHETGGLALGNGNVPYYSNIALLNNQKGSYVALESQFKADIAADNFSFDTCLARIADFYGNEEFNDSELYQLRLAYDVVMNGLDMDEVSLKTIYNIKPATKTPAERCGAIVTVVNSIFDSKAGIGWSTFAHSASQVPVSALGVGAENFTGLFDNTEINHKITKLLVE